MVALGRDKVHIDCQFLRLQDLPPPQAEEENDKCTVAHDCVRVPDLEQEYAQEPDQST